MEKSLRLYYYTSNQFGMKSLRERRLKIGTYSALNDPFELLPYQMPEVESRRIMDLVSGILSRNHGVICLSEAWNSNLMWAHYADKHQGMCLGFDVPADERVTKIRYVKKRIKSPVELTTNPEGLDEAWFATVLNAKSHGWAYEKEHRLRVSLTDMHDGLYFKKFDEDIALREVFIGSRCSLSHQDVAEAIGQPDHDVVIRTVRPAHTTFSMVVDRENAPLTVNGLPTSTRHRRLLAKALMEDGKPAGIIASAMKSEPSN